VKVILRRLRNAIRGDIVIEIRRVADGARPTGNRNPLRRTGFQEQFVHGLKQDDGRHGVDMERFHETLGPCLVFWSQFSALVNWDIGEIHWDICGEPRRQNYSFQTAYITRRDYTKGISFLRSFPPFEVWTLKFSLRCSPRYSLRCILRYIMGYKHPCINTTGAHIDFYRKLCIFGTLIRCRQFWKPKS